MSDKPGNVFHANIAGVTFSNPDGTSRQELIRRCRIGDEILLIRDRNNKHDASAVIAMHRVGQLGWIKSAGLEEFAEFLDRRGRATAKICQLTGGTRDKPTLGVNIEITEWRTVEPAANIAAALIPPRIAAQTKSTTHAPKPEAVKLNVGPNDLVAGKPSTDEVRISAEIADAHTHQQRLKQQLSLQEKRHSQIRRAKLWLSVERPYFRAAELCRLLAQRLIGFRLGMVVIYAAILLLVALLCKIAVGFGPVLFAIDLIAIGLVAALHFLPSDEVLERAGPRVAAQQGQLAAEIIQLERNLERLRIEQAQLVAGEASLQEELRRANRQWQLQQRRLALARLPWKTFRGPELEQFLKQVFEALGCSAETTKVTGDQGADLVVTLGQVRWVVQVKGYVSSVSNEAVQQVYAAMRFYSCHKCMVITNSVFTASAIQLAKATNCILIDEHSLPHMILGEIDLRSLTAPPQAIGPTSGKLNAGQFGI